MSMGNLFNFSHGRYGKWREIARFWFDVLIHPRSKRDEPWRKEFILNVVLLATIAVLTLFGIFLVRNAIVQGQDYEGLPLSIFFSIFTFLIILYGISRAGYPKAASYVLVITLFLASALNNYRWGIDVPGILLGYGFLVVMTGILINSAAALLITVVIGATLNEIAYLQLAGIISLRSHWRMQMFTQRDAVEFFLYLLIIAAVSWLSNREIDFSMHRAFRSERALLRQREQLEELVELRTNELREAQIQRIEQLYRFAEFGKLASGFFHDLSNPLATLQLYLGDLKTASSAQVAEFQEDVKQAISIANHIETFTQSMKQQLRQSAVAGLFSVETEICNVLQMMSHRILTSSIAINVDCPTDSMTFGNPLRFHQIILNVVTNAIDAYAAMGDVPKPVSIQVRCQNEMIKISVQDHGKGFNESTKSRIFEPFFSTKPNGSNMGIGLASTKAIIEKDFGGTIAAESAEGLTIFTITIPQRYAEI